MKNACLICGCKEPDVCPICGSDDLSYWAAGEEDFPECKSCGALMRGLIWYLPMNKTNTVTITLESGEIETVQIGPEEAKVIARVEDAVFLEVDLSDVDIMGFQQFQTLVREAMPSKAVVFLPLGTRQLKVTDRSNESHGPEVTD